MLARIPRVWSWSASLRTATGADIAVLVIDSHGRAWRQGTVGVAIGAAGLPALLDLRGQPDRHGRPLRVTEVGLADELAAAASLLMGQAGERHAEEAGRRGLRCSVLQLPSLAFDVDTFDDYCEWRSKGQAPFDLCGRQREGAGFTPSPCGELWGRPGRARP